MESSRQGLGGTRKGGSSWPTLRDRLFAAQLAPHVQRRLLILSSLLLFSANLAFQYPGWWLPDSQAAYADAVSGHYSDGEPPIMAWLWSIVRRLVDGNPGMLTLQLAFHWLGFALVADGLMRVSKPRSAWLVLLSGAFPVFLYFNGTVLRDVGMASALVTAFGLAFNYRIAGRAIPGPALCAAGLLLAYGTLVRTNAIFALGPLLIYLLPSRVRLMSIKVQIALTVVLAGLALPLSSLINRDVFGTHPVRRCRRPCSCSTSPALPTRQGT